MNGARSADAAMLKKRAAIIRRVRAFFDARGFTEVETAVKIPAPAPEEHIDCPPCGAEFLRASPELQMKKLLALEGLDKIYQIGPCFREGERGSRHNPEFTMLEWYRRGATYLDIADDLDDLLDDLAGESVKKISSAANRRLDVRSAYVKYAGWDPWREFDQDRFDYDMAMVIEPVLKRLGGGVYLIDYPAEACSLAKVENGRAQRWEYYFDGLELANCFTELCDVDEQRRRFLAAREKRRDLGEADYPTDEKFFEKLGLIGSAAGVALGIDRLVMTLTGETDILHTRPEI